jgi:hypothetical protein
MASVGVIKGKWMCASPVVGHLCLALHFVIGSLWTWSGAVCKVSACMTPNCSGRKKCCVKLRFCVLTVLARRSVCHAAVFVINAVMGSHSGRTIASMPRGPVVWLWTLVNRASQAQLVKTSQHIFFKVGICSTSTMHAYSRAAYSRAVRMLELQLVP